MRSRSILLAAALGLIGAGLCVGCGEAAGNGEAQASSSTRFARDPARFKANQQKLVDATRQQSPQVATALE